MRNPPLHSVEAIWPNMTLVEHGDVEILYSYKVPVVIHDRTGRGVFYITGERHSATTTRHIKKYLREYWGRTDAEIKTIERLTQDDINRIAAQGFIERQNPGRLARDRADTGPRPGAYGGSAGRTPTRNTPMTKREAYEAGVDAGIGAVLYGEFESDDPEEIAQEAYEIEDNARQFSPFEFLATDINRSRNADTLWEEYERGVSDGVAQGIRDRFGE